MRKWMIDKTFEFCYGHRVWTQTLDSRFADDLKCACRHLHGHEGKVQVFLEGETLNPQGMVTDFRHLEWLKKWLNQYVDHQFIIDRNDPLFPVLFNPSQVDLIPLVVESTLLGVKDTQVVGHTLTFSPDLPISKKCLKAFWS